MSGMEGCLSGALKWLSKVPQHALNCPRAIKLQNSLFQNPVTSYRGYKPAGGRIVDATPVSAPRQWMSGQEKERAKTGESASDIRPDDPAKAARKDTNARWTVKYSKAGKTQRRQGGCRFPISGTRTISRLTVSGALSAARPGPTPPGMMGINRHRFRMGRTVQRASGRIPDTGPPGTKHG